MSSKLSPILKNRIKIININGYTLNEKINIIRNYALPKIISSSIFSNHNVVFNDSNISYFINNKIQIEDGMRTCIQSIKELIDKLQLEMISNNTKLLSNKSIIIDKKCIDKYFPNI